MEQTLPTNVVVRDADDNPITDVAAALNWMRDMFATEHDGDRCSQQNDEDLLAILTSVPGDDKDQNVLNQRLLRMSEAEPSESGKLLETEGQPDTTPLLPEGSHPLAKLATEAALHMNDATYTNEVVVPLEEAGEKMKQGPIAILFSILRLHNYEQKWDDDGKLVFSGPVQPCDMGNPSTFVNARKNISRWPIPGNPPKDYKGNAVFEKFSVRVIKDDGTSKSEPRYFYRETYLKTEHGKFIASMIAKYQDKESSEYIKSQSRKGDQDRWKGRLTNVVGKLKTAKKIADVWEAIDDKFSGNIVVDFIREADKETGLMTQKPEITDTPIRLTQVGGKSLVVKINQFTRLNPAKSANKTLDALMETIPPRKKKGVTDLPGAGAVAAGLTANIPTVQQAEAQATMFLHALEVPAFQQVFTKHLAEDETVIETYGDIFTELLPFFDQTIGTSYAAYVNIKAKRSAEERAELAKAEAAKAEALKAKKPKAA